MKRTTALIATLFFLSGMMNELSAEPQSLPNTRQAVRAAVRSEVPTNARTLARNNVPSLRQRVREVMRESKSFMHGVAKPIREVDLTSPSTGTISDVMVEDGDTVTKGQRLIEFDVRLTEARVAMAQADFQRSTSAVKATELEYRLAASRFKNTAEAYRQNAATDVELTEAQIRWQQSRARYQAAMDEVKSSVESRSYAQVENQLRTIEAPFDGKVVQVLAVPGQSPMAQDTLVRLVDTTRLRVELYVPVAQFKQISGKQSVELQAESPVNRRLHANVIVIDDVIEPATQTIRCVLEIHNKDRSLPAGFRVRL